MPVVSVKDLTTDLLIRYGFQILGALVILGVGLAAGPLGGQPDGAVARAPPTSSRPCAA